MRTTKILAIAGSLRAASINAAFCRAAQRLAPEGVSVTLYTGLGDLPHYNFDLEDAVPERVIALRHAVAEANALLIASPEYAHGVAGSLKNALDWLVGFDGFVNKPIAVINTSPRAHHAYDALQETLRTMSATMIGEGSMVVPLIGDCTTEDAIVRSVTASSQVREILASVRAFVGLEATIP
ncbi:MAG: NAD(P)H-dependent oxidoreductase [Burkholderiales bacterium]|nr:NAD(P)H-dependent oxidoreductase [Burkholderiales bacterium]